MRYIKKSNEPPSLLAVKTVKTKTFVPKWEALPPYVIIDIIQNLLKDQGWLCCYCMNSIAPEAARLVHFHPFAEEELDYGNMYLACNHSNHLPPKQQHCYIKKGNELIPKYIADVRCSNYFRYNTLGEILPHCEFRTVKKCRDNFFKLTPTEQTVFSTIELLNLNAENLKDQRKAILTQVAGSVRWATKGQIHKFIENMGKPDKDGRLKRFCEVIIYYLRTIS